jgi:DNA polymerase-3 subunit gamma/tau
MSQALYRKWRPAEFDEIVGQEHVTTTLRHAIAGGRISHAYLFSGPRGTGKTSAARLLAKAVNCLDPDPARRPCNQCVMCQAVNEGRLLDLIEIDAASNTGVDDVRDLRDKIAFSPNEGQYKVYIIDEVHMLSTAAFNALLKTLEEPPPHAIFVLATTESHKVPATVTSRCQCFTFRRLPSSVIVERLQGQCARDGLQVEPAALALIARHATGSLRDAISLLDQLIVAPEEPVTLAQAQALLGAAGGETVMALVDAWLEGDAARGLDVIAAAMNDGIDPRQFARQVVEHLRYLLLVKAGSAELVDVAAEARAALQRQAAATATPRVLAALKRWNAATQDLRAGWQPQLPLEMAFVESLGAPEPAGAPAAVAAPQARAQAPAPAVPAAPREREAARPAAAKQPAARKTPAPVTAGVPPASGAAAVPPAPAEPEVTLAQVTARWQQVLDAVRTRNRNAVAVIREATPVSVDGRTLVLAFEHTFHKERVAEDKTRGLMQDALAQVLGTTLLVRCVLASEPVQPAGPAAGDDDLVSWAKNELGAKTNE